MTRLKIISLSHIFFCIFSEHKKKAKMEEQRIRVGYCGSQRKWERFKWSDFVKYAESKNVEIVPIDLSRPIEDQGKFDLILHKMTYSFKHHDMHCNPKLSRLYEYSQKHPEVAMIDDLDAVAITLDRKESDDFLKKVQWKGKVEVLCPNSKMLLKSDIETIKDVTSDMHFPLLAKAKVSSFTSEIAKDTAHMMRLVTLPEQLVGFPTPAFLQEYINHGGVIYKCYALGSQLDCDLRPSTRDIQPGEKFHVDFHSQHSEEQNGIWTKPRDFSDVKVPMNDFIQISSDLRKALHVDLLGFDVIIDKNNKFWIIDLNYFPGYKHVDNLWPKFLNFIMEKLGLPKR